MVGVQNFNCVLAYSSLKLCTKYAKPMWVLKSAKSPKSYSPNRTSSSALGHPNCWTFIQAEVICARQVQIYLYSTTALNLSQELELTCWVKSTFAPFSTMELNLKIRNFHARSVHTHSFFPHRTELTHAHTLKTDFLSIKSQLQKMHAQALMHEFCRKSVLMKNVVLCIFPSQTTVPFPIRSSKNKPWTGLGNRPMMK